MIHKMKLQNGPFEAIKSGIKTIEMRLYDEKRQLIKENDFIEFQNVKTGEILRVIVVSLYRYNSFDELYDDFDKCILGYSDNEVANASDMELYYSKVEQEKYGVLGIEIKLCNQSNKKEIIINHDDLVIEDINRVVRRVKILIINDKDELILCFSNGNYFLLGGHVEDNESDMACLHRELLEEAGVEVNFLDLEAFMTIKYFNKDYPDKGINTFTMANYYILNYNLIPNLSKMNLTEEEKKHGFRIVNINKKDIIKILEDSLEMATRKAVTLDTIKVIKEYLNGN